MKGVLNEASTTAFLKKFKHLCHFSTMAIHHKVFSQQSEATYKVACKSNLTLFLIIPLAGNTSSPDWNQLFQRLQLIQQPPHSSFVCSNGELHPENTKEEKSENEHQKMEYKPPINPFSFFLISNFSLKVPI